MLWGGVERRNVRVGVHVGDVMQAPNGDLLHELIHQWPSYVAFFVSFIYVGVVWMNHHGLFRHIRYVDRRLQWINMGILMMVVLLPFPTAVLAEALAQGNPHNERVAVALYALLAGAMSAVWIPLFRYLRSHPYLLESPVDTSYFEVQGIRPLTGVILYSLAGVAGLLSPTVGLALFAVVALFYAVTSDGVKPRKR